MQEAAFAAEQFVGTDIKITGAGGRTNEEKILPVVAAAVLIVVLAAILIVSKVVDKYIPTTKRWTLQEYYGIAGEGQVP